MDPAAQPLTLLCDSHLDGEQLGDGSSEEVGCAEPRDATADDEDAAEVHGSGWKEMRGERRRGV